MSTAFRHLSPIRELEVSRELLHVIKRQCARSGFKASGDTFVTAYLATKNDQTERILEEAFGPNGLSEEAIADPLVRLKAQGYCKNHSKITECMTKVPEDEGEIDESTLREATPDETLLFSIYILHRLYTAERVIVTPLVIQYVIVALDGHNSLADLK